MKTILFQISLLFLPFISIQDAYSQNVMMVRSFLNQFENMKPAEIENDQVIEGAAAFPVESKFTVDLYKKALSDAGEYIVLEELESDYTQLGDKEYTLVSVKPLFTYINLPCFQCINGWYDAITIKDMGGNDLRLSEDMVNEYTELGLIEDEFNYPMPAEYGEKFWLNREPDYNEMLNVSGKLKLEIPEDYDMYIFSQEDNGKSIEIYEVTFKLIDIENNIATFYIKGDLRKIENIKTIFLNTENLPFGSMSAVAIDADLYDLDENRIKNLSDKEIEENIQKFSMQNLNVEQVKKFKVPGNIEKVVILRVHSTMPLEQEFSVNKVASY